MRTSKHQWGLGVAWLTAMRGTCRRRQVGCVLVDADGFILATGYNGKAAGLDHCLDHPCPGALASSGQDLDRCEAIHAEQNALLRCQDVRRIDTCYVTTSPCVTCTKLLLNTGCKRIVYLQDYPQPDAEKLWQAAGREWLKFFGALVV